MSDEERPQPDGFLSALAEAQTHTGDRLNTLITTIERYVERRNGKFLIPFSKRVGAR